MKSLKDPIQLSKQGYRRVSRKFGHVARVDREDWKEFMGQKHGGGMSWVNALGKAAADHYRRCYSKDVLILDPQKALKVPASEWDETGFVAKGGSDE